MAIRHFELIERARQLRKNATPSERKLWELLRGGGLGVKFYRQRVVGPFIPDFYCPAHQLVVEVDGAVHEHAVVRVRDVAREEWFLARGYVVLRCTASDVEQRVGWVVEQVRAVIGARPPRWCHRSSI